MLSIVTTQFHQMNLQATKEADCYMHIYFNAFKQRIVLRSSYKAKEKYNRIIKINWYCIGIADLGCCIVLYWYWCQKACIVPLWILKHDINIHGLEFL